MTDDFKKHVAAVVKDVQFWEPSYRSEMDGDGDGGKCESYRGS